LQEKQEGGRKCEDRGEKGRGERRKEGVEGAEGEGNKRGWRKAQRRSSKPS